jgi:hypothetical protein
MVQTQQIAFCSFHSVCKVIQSKTPYKLFPVSCILLN